MSRCLVLLVHQKRETKLRDLEKGGLYGKFLNVYDEKENSLKLAGLNFLFLFFFDNMAYNLSICSMKLSG